MWINVILAAVSAYLLGNLNGAIIISRLVARDDVRNHGSGNAGFTNFFRNYGGLGSLMVMAIDAAKTAAACLLAGYLMGRSGMRQEGLMIGALAVSIGHDFPAFLGFKGGKGIICGFVASVVNDWRIGAVLLVVFAATYFSTNYVSLSSILAAAGFGVGFALLYFDHPVIMICAVLTALLAIVMHHENIGRLIRKEERKTYFFGRKKEK